ncbi:MAG: TRAP transporter substrate-binding protein DctP [Desulfobacteraceae bacterium]|nr:TRAP transporter substrate-binding protein DctP [Desulfobacteraceae bacterium]
MKRIALITVLSVLLMFTASTALAEMNLKLGMPAPPSHPHTIGNKWFADYVEQQTDGEITIDVFPMSQLGGERSMAEQVQGGTLAMADITTAVMSNFVPQVAMMDLPFFWPSRGVAYSVLADSEFKEMIFDPFRQKGMVAIGYGENEWRDLTNTKRVVQKPEDVKGLKIRVMEAPVYLETWRALGANPTPMPFPEVYNALQQGVIDAQENPIMTSVLMKFTEVCDYATIMNYCLSASIKIVNIDIWNQLTPEQQEIFRQGAQLAIKKIREGSMQKTMELIDKIKSEGDIKITHLTPEQRAAFENAVKPIHEKYKEKLGTIPDKEKYGRYAGMSYIEMAREKMEQYK